jgi:hypothetical protein
MLQRIAPVFIVAAVLIVANGCSCMSPSHCGDAASCDSCGVGCDSYGCAPAPRKGDCLADCTTKTLKGGSGCGDIYWGPEINDPPASCDPCNRCKDWTGGASCDPICNPLSGLGHLWGYRYASDCPDAGFDASGDPLELLPADEEVRPQAVPPVPVPEPSPKEASRKRHVRHATYWRPSGR